MVARCSSGIREGNGKIIRMPGLTPAILTYENGCICPGATSRSVGKPWGRPSTNELIPRDYRVSGNIALRDCLLSPDGGGEIF